MKKFIKLACLALTLILLCLTFCSCNKLDEMKDSQAFYKGEDIVFRGEIYKKLPQLYEGTFIHSYDTQLGQLTKDDVPVLLSGMFGNTIFYSPNGIIHTNLYHGPNSSEIYYCREDIYVYLSEAIKKNELNYMFVSYYDYNSEKTKFQMLDEYLTAIFKNTIVTEPLCNYEDYYNDNSQTYHTEIYINVSDEKMLLHGQDFELIYDLSSKKYNLIDHHNYVVLSVPTKYTSDVDILVYKIKEAKENLQTN